MYLPDTKVTKDALWVVGFFHELALDYPSDRVKKVFAFMIFQLAFLAHLKMSGGKNLITLVIPFL